MGFVTAGLGNGGNLVTVGLGLTTVIIITPPKDIEGIKDSTKGTSVVNEYHKRRVKGLNLKNDTGTVILQTVTSKSEIPLKVFQYLKIDEKEQSRILKKLEEQIDNKIDFGVLVIKKSSSSITLKQHYLMKLEQKTGFKGDKLLNFLEKQINIDETKHINVTNILDSIEVVELLDILKTLEDADV